MSHSLTNSLTLNQYRTDEKSSSDSSGAELRGSVSSDESAAGRRQHWIRGEAGSCYLQRHSPSLRLRLLLFHTTFWFDPRQKDLTEVRTEAEGERRIRFLLWCIECGCSVGWSRCSFFFFFYCFRLVSSSQLTWSPLHSVIISLPCSHFLLWGENQPDSVASSSSSSIHLSTFQQWVRQILHVSPRLTSWPPSVSPPSEICLRGSFHLHTAALLAVFNPHPAETCEVIVSFLEPTDHLTLLMFTCRQ